MFFPMCIWPMQSFPPNRSKSPLGTYCDCFIKFYISLEYRKAILLAPMLRKEIFFKKNNKTLKEQAIIQGSCRKCLGEREGMGSGVPWSFVLQDNTEYLFRLVTGKIMNILWDGEIAVFISMGNSIHEKKKEIVKLLFGRVCDTVETAPFHLKNLEENFQ